MKLRFTVLSILFALLLAACSSSPVGEQQDTVVGSGKSATETRPVGTFSSISVTGDANLYIEQGDTASLTITADDNILPLLESRIESDKLILASKDKTLLNSKVDIEYRVIVQDLKVLEGTGNINVQAKGIEAENLTIRLEGSSTAILAGKAAHQEVTLIGNSDYQSQDLQGLEGTFTMEGNSQALVNVSDLLIADLSGNSILEYMGNPKINQKVEGSSLLQQH